MSTEPMRILLRDEELARVQQVWDQQSNDAALLEYGIGGSTIMWASRLKPTQRLYAIEHTKDWQEKVAAELSASVPPDVWSASIASIVNIICAPVTQPETSYSHPEEELSTDATHYIQPGVPWDDIRMIIVDGIARGACLATVRMKCRPGTVVFLHDYLGRESWYEWAVNLYPPGKITESLLELQIPE